MALTRFSGRVAATLLLILSLLLSTLGTALGTATGSSAGAPAPLGAWTVTLITGDKVAVQVMPDGRHAATVDPAPRQSGIPPFRITEVNDDVYVTPGDVARLVPDQLDPELFNVTGLIRQGYHDGLVSELPIIITYPEVSLFAAPKALPAAKQVRSLGSVRGAAVRVEKGKAAAFAEALALTEVGSPAPALPGIEKIWLDRKVTVSLAESVPQIGAPEAWEAGYDGTGILVAVLDTGIDASHPDVAEKVVAAANFTPSSSDTDRHGHGTHVAATVAGIGAASGGSRKGVAPGAQLLSGKVLDDNGSGDWSWVIAGMEWAARNGAHVINMSLGGGATDGTDPVSQAVNALTEEYGVLFVIAAGNMGPGNRSVGTPGAASAALTVGAVDRADSLAWFSSRGPRVGDFAIKPDITAPGVDIVAARATGTTMGSPVNQHYTAASGTSMAAPHVAGAAALLRQQRPDLSPEALKAALVTTAKPHTNLSVYQQGGGRIDIPRAVEQAVVVNQATVDFGYFAYPHTDVTPVTRSVTFTNLGTEPVTLSLAASLLDEHGTPAAPGMLTLGQTEVTVPAGGAESITMTVDVTAGPYGLYGGYLTATSADGSVRINVPLGFYYESERYTLTIEATAADGRPGGGISSVDVMNVDDGSVLTTLWFENGEASLRVPPGNYSVAGYIFTYDAAHTFVTDLIFTSEPEVAVTGDTTIHLDARGASMVTIDLGRDADPFSSMAAYHRRARSGYSFSSSFHVQVPIGATPTAPITTGAFEFYTKWGMRAPQIRMRTTEHGQLGINYMTGSPLYDGEEQLPLVYAGLGYPEDFANIDVTGSIALIERGVIPFAEKARNAHAAGAKMAIVFNNAPGDFSGTVGDQGLIPTFSLPRETGLTLRDLLQSGESVTVSVAGQPISPFQYELVFPEPDLIPASLKYTVRETDLAAIESHYYSHKPSDIYWNARHHWRPWSSFSFGFADQVPVPSKKTVHVTAGEERWQQTVWPIFGIAGMTEAVKTYAPGSKETDTWFKQALRPGVILGRPAMASVPVFRQGDSLFLQVPEFMDSANHFGWTYSDVVTSFRLYRDGELINQTARPIGEFSLPAEQAQYRMELEVDKSAAAWSPYSSLTKTAWSFTSQRPDHTGRESVALLLVDYEADLTSTNRMLAPNEANGANTLSFKVFHQPGASNQAIGGAKLWISYDDGQSWREIRNLRVQGDGRFQANLDRRDGDGYLSVKVEAWDTAGNRIEQEVIRAFGLPDRGK